MIPNCSPPSSSSMQLAYAPNPRQPSLGPFHVLSGVILNRPPQSSTLESTWSGNNRAPPDLTVWRNVRFVRFPVPTKHTIASHHMIRFEPGKRRAHQPRSEWWSAQFRIDFEAHRKAVLSLRRARLMTNKCAALIQIDIRRHHLHRYANRVTDRLHVPSRRRTPIYYSRRPRAVNCLMPPSAHSSTRCIRLQSKAAAAARRSPGPLRRPRVQVASHKTNSPC